MDLAKELIGCQMAVIAVDVSGSTYNTGVLDKWLSQIHRGIQASTADLYLVTFDNQIQRIFAGKETINNILQLNSAHGGTDPVSVIEHFDVQYQRPDKYLIFTDGFFSRPIPDHVDAVVQEDFA